MKKGLGITLLLLGVALVAAWASLNELARRGIERAATHATGEPATLRSARLGVVAGDLDLDQLALANPEGYAAPSFLQVEAFHVTVNPRSLLNDTVRVPRVSLAGANLDLERKGTATNFGDILRHMKRLGGSAGAAEEEEKRFIVDELDIHDVRVQATYAQSRTAQLALPPIVLRNIGAERGGVTLSQLANVVVRALLEEAGRSAGLPAELQQPLNARLEEFRRLQGNVPEEIESEARRRAEELLQREKGRLFGTE